MSGWGMRRVAIGVPDIIMLVFTVTLQCGLVLKPAVALRIADVTA
jgi:hypothetical protein